MSANKRPIYLGKEEYPRGFCAGTARTAHCFFPHFEQRRRFATSWSFASQPHNRPRIFGTVERSYPQAEQVRISVYCPNSSLSFSTRNAAMPRIVHGQCGRVHPVLSNEQHCISARGDSDARVEFRGNRLGPPCSRTAFSHGDTCHETERSKKDFIPEAGDRYTGLLDLLKRTRQ